MIEAIRGKVRLFGVSMGVVAILLSACAQAKSPGAVGSPPAPQPSVTPSASPPAPSPSPPAPKPKPKPKPAAQVAIRSSDGTEQTMAGFDGGRGFCRVCQADLGTDARRVRWGFIFRLKREFLRQRLQFVYGPAPPIELTLST